MCGEELRSVVLAGAVAFGIQSFRPPAACESLSFAYPNESNQRKGHPDAAVDGQESIDCAGALRGSLMACPYAGNERAPVVGSPLRAFPPPARRGIGAPGQARAPARVEPRREPTPLRCFGQKRAGARALAGPFNGAEERSAQRGKGKSVRRQGRRSWCRPVAGQSRRASRSLRKRDTKRRKPLLRFRHFGHPWPSPRWPSLWLFSLGHARESDWGRPKGGPKCF